MSTPVQPPSPPDLIQAEQARAQALCALALQQTPEAYHSFIVKIKQKKKVGGTRQNPIYAEIELPYMSADGRIKMARDEHLAAGKHVEVKTEFVVEPISKQLVARAEIHSEMLGTATAHARVFLGGDGPHETNPLETAETSAIGRAWGFLGYGCLGTGVASAEEVLRAQKVQGGDDGAGAGTSTPGRAEPPRDPAAEAETAALIAEASRRLRPAEIDLLRAQAPTDQTFHDALRQRLAAFRPAPAAEAPAPPATTTPAGTGPASGDGSPSSETPAPPDLQARRVDRGQLLLYANQLGVSIAAYQAYLGKKYRVSHAGELSDAQLAEEIERFLRRYQEPVVAEGFRSQCQRLAEEPEP